MYKIEISERTLHFKQPAGTGRIYHETQLLSHPYIG